MANNKICCLFDLAAHYRAPIYKKMDKELDCDFYIATWPKIPFKQMNYSDLKGFKKNIQTKWFFNNKMYWQIGAIKLLFSPYKHYILTGVPHCLTTWIILLGAKITGKKTYLWTHGWYGDETLLKKIIKKMFFSLSYKVLLYGNYAKNLMIKEGYSKEKLIVIYNSLDYKSQLKLRRKITKTNIYQHYFNNNYPVLLFIGRIQKSKKIDLLFEAILQLKVQGNLFNLILIGKNYNDIDINENINYRNLKNNVWLFGECYDEQLISELIYNADLCVSPGFVGLTAMHCLVYGLPVITHNNFPNQAPEFEAIEPDVTGDFFIEDSVEDLMLYIKKWTNLSNSKKQIIRHECFKIIDEKYNPNIQISILKNTIR